MVSAAGIPLTVAHSVSPQNLKDVDKMCDLAYSLGAGNLILGEISLSGRTFGNHQLLLNDDEKEVLLEKVEYNANRFRGKMQIQRSMDDKLKYVQNTGIPSGGLIIRPDGDVRMDCMTPFVLGNVLQSDFAEIWEQKGFNCWDRPEVKEYYEGDGEKIKNYVDKDIVL